MEQKQMDQEKVSRSGSQDQPDRSFGSKDTSSDKDAMTSGRKINDGGATEADDELASESSFRETASKKPL